MSKLIRFVNHSFWHFFIHDVEVSRNDSNQFKNGGTHILSPMVITMLCTRKPNGEQGDEGSFGTSCMSSNQERSHLPPSNPRLDGGRSKLTLPSQYIFSDRPA